MEKGLKDLTQACRQAQRKPGTFWNKHDGSSTGISDSENTNNTLSPNSSPATMPGSYIISPLIRVPPIHSTLKLPELTVEQQRVPYHEQHMPNRGIVSTRTLTPFPVSNGIRQVLAKWGIPAYASAYSRRHTLKYTRTSTITTKDDPQDKRDDDVKRSETTIKRFAHPKLVLSRPSSPSPHRDDCYITSGYPDDASTPPGNGDDASTSSEASLQSLDSDLDGMEEQKEYLLDRLMLQVYGIFEPQDSSGRQCRGSSESPRTSPQEHEVSKNQGRGGTEKHPRSSEEGDEDKNREDEPNKRPRRLENHGPSSQKDRAKPFACPFLKHNPAKYNKTRSCAGPAGWEKIARLK